MCWSTIKSWFHREKQEEQWALPHPEEPPNPVGTVTNLEAFSLITQFLQSYHVPLEHRSFWQSVNLIITNDVPFLETISQIKQTKANPQWVNPGSLAHEFAHISYFLLSEALKADFRRAYQEELLVRDSLVQRVYAIKKKNMLDPVEAHAEIFRFLGEQLPLALKTFYPKLF